MTTGSQNMPLKWCQFSYSSPDNPGSILESALHGERRSNDTDSFVLDENDRINKVQVLVDDETLYVGGITKCVSLIRGIRFFTTNGKFSRSIDHLPGELHTEKFDGYTVGYVSGRSGLRVDQLQFHWYRNIMN